VVGLLFAHCQRERSTEAELAEVKQLVREASARIVGIQAELRALSAGDAPLNDLASGSRTDAIEEILRRHDGTMRPKEIQAALEEAGRPASMRAVTATLNHLIRSRSTVRCASRGEDIST
jgi:hypothetical protein